MVSFRDSDEQVASSRSGGGDSSDSATVALATAETFGRCLFNRMLYASPTVPAGCLLEQCSLAHAAHHSKICELTDRVYNSETRLASVEEAALASAKQCERNTAAMHATIKELQTRIASMDKMLAATRSSTDMAAAMCNAQKAEAATAAKHHADLAVAVRNDRKAAHTDNTRLFKELQEDRRLAQGNHTTVMGELQELHNQVNQLLDDEQPDI